MVFKCSLWELEKIRSICVSKDAIDSMVIINPDVMYQTYVDKKYPENKN